MAVVTFISLLSCSESTLAGVNANVNLDIGAESMARVALYYKNEPVTNSGIDFPLPINSVSQRFERLSELFYLVGNVPQAEIVFTDSVFVLNPLSGHSEGVKLNGYFVYQGTSTAAQVPLQVPVLNNISDATLSTGFKVHFSSEFSAGFYTQGNYANTFTLLVTPKI